MARLITTKIKLDGKTVRLGGPPSYERRQMLALGQFAVSTVKARVARGVGSDDSPFPGLTKRYAIKKNRAGYGNKRNLSFTGEMLRAFSVRYADATQVRMDITTRHGREAANGNEKRTPWYGFSRFDESAIIREAQAEFGKSVAQFRARAFRGAGRSAA